MKTTHITRKHTYIHQCSTKKRVNEHQPKKKPVTHFGHWIQALRIVRVCIACTYNDVCFEFRRSKSIFVFISKYAYNFSLKITTTKNGVTSSSQSIWRSRFCMEYINCFGPLIEFIDCSFLNITVFQISRFGTQNVLVFCICCVCV